MHRVNGFFSRGKSLSSSQSLDSLSSSAALASALSSVELILDDDIAGAEAGLAEGHSAFHSLCKGVLGFMKATLGFEQEVMKEASLQLSDAEAAAYQGHHRAQREGGNRGTIYDRGAEYSLCIAEAQIMSAVVGVLNESLTESIKGFYKLRKAYGTLEGLMAMEHRFMRTQGNASLQPSRNQSKESLGSVGSNGDSTLDAEKKEVLSPRRDKEAAHANHPSRLKEALAVDDVDEDSDDEFYEVENEAPTTAAYTGHFDSQSDDALASKLQATSLTTSRPTTSDSNLPTTPTKHQSATAMQLLTADPDNLVFSSPLDVFIHSGTNLCFGLLSLLISAIPPAFSKLLFIIGFRGDRERGMRMLWQASKFPNINGGMAGLIILGWYNGLVGFCDIIPDPDPNLVDEIEGYPAQRLNTLLSTMRTRYPNSGLWLIESARMAASERQLSRALDLLEANPARKNTLKQLEALHAFERALNSMHAHRYLATASSFLACVDLNNWSQALYYYIAGAAHLEIYRSSESSDAEKREAAQIATEYFKTAPGKAGRKKMMGRQLPFDTFVLRKIAKWESNASKRGCEFIDAVGVSPLEEMIFFWNGYKKMDIANLERSLQNLAWSESSPQWKESPEDIDADEKGILAVLRAVVLRNLRRHDESRAQLQTVLSSDPAAFKAAPHMDDWPHPVAHYEMAVNLWMQRRGYIAVYGTGVVTVAGARNTPSVASSDDLQHDRHLVREVKTHIDKAKGWEKYSLDARIGMKVTAAGDAVRNWETKHGTGQ